MIWFAVQHAMVANAAIVRLRCQTDCLLPGHEVAENNVVFANLVEALPAKLCTGHTAAMEHTSIEALNTDLRVMPLRIDLDRPPHQWRDVLHLRAWRVSHDPLECRPQRGAQVAFGLCGRLLPGVQPRSNTIEPRNDRS